MNQCILSLGSNQKCPERQIRQAIQSIRALPQSHVVQVSRLHWSKAWGLEVQQDFCNVVLKVHTRLTPLKLLIVCQNVERRQGRIRKKHWGPRTLDIDIILYNKRVIKTAKLTLPHPYYTQRDFVLIPLQEIRSETLAI